MSRAEAVRILAAALAEAYGDRITVAEAARDAYCAGGPTIAELEQLIAEQRARRTV